MRRGGRWRPGRRGCESSRGDGVSRHEWEAGSRETNGGFSHPHRTFDQDLRWSGDCRERPDPAGPAWIGVRPAGAQRGRQDDHRAAAVGVAASDGRSCRGSGTVLRHSTRRPSAASIGYLPTHPSFPEHLRPVEYLDLLGRLSCIPRDVRHPRLTSLLRAVGLLGATNQKIRTFSTGMRTRLGIAASLLADPPLLDLG